VLPLDQFWISLGSRTAFKSVFFVRFVLPPTKAIQYTICTIQYTLHSPKSTLQCTHGPQSTKTLTYSKSSTYLLPRQSYIIMRYISTYRHVIYNIRIQHTVYTMPACPTPTLVKWVCEGRQPMRGRIFLACPAPCGTVDRSDTQGLQCTSCTLQCQQSDSQDHKGPHMPRIWGGTYDLANHGSF